MNNTVPIEYGEFVGQPVEVPAMRVAGVPQWQPIETAPNKGQPFLAWYPQVRLDEDDNLTDETFGGAAAIIAVENGQWEEPEWLTAHGSYYMEDWCFAEIPTHWMPLPAPPGAAPSPIADAPATQPEAEKADAVDAKSRPFGCALAMGVLQSDLYRQLDDVQRAECDELVRRNLEWFKADAAIASLEKPHAD
jgi:hypothetical protein